MTVEKLAKEQSQVEKELEIMSRELDDLGRLLGDLESGLSPILRDPEPCDTAGGAGEDHIVEVAAAIRNRRQSVQMYGEMLRSIINRVEV